MSKSRRRNAPSSWSPMFSLRTVIFILILAIGWILFHVPELNRYLEVRDQRDEQRERVEQLEGQIASLEDKLERGPYEDERALRERFKMVKPGERLIEVEIQEEDGSLELKPPAPPSAP